MTEELWATVDNYLVSLLSPSDDALDKALSESDAAGLPRINVAPNQGKLLELLAKSHGARRILEIGTLGGYSTIWLARSLSDGGQLVSLELETKHADVARSNIKRAGLESVVEIRVGPAASSLRDLIGENVEPFDLIFIDADKEGYPEYFALSLELSRVGTMIIADNVVRAGGIVDPQSTDERVLAVRAFLELVAEEDRVEATAVQTVGSKGYDGFALMLVKK
ncbi:MAG TPA: O-methyltransferase [Acidimicrobiales bacterium]|jgi:predicted O-methyltransferase YrrM|nr:O-methyltransferase [Acidimicrobiales bacterium]